MKRYLVWILTGLCCGLVGRSLSKIPVELNIATVCFMLLLCAICFFWFVIAFAVDNHRFDQKRLIWLLFFMSGIAFFRYILTFLLRFLAVRDIEPGSGNMFLVVSGSSVLVYFVLTSFMDRTKETSEVSSPKDSTGQNKGVRSQ